MKSYLVVLVMLMLPVGSLMITRFQRDRLVQGYAFRSLSRELADCRSISLTATNAQSSFVGRLEYGHFIYGTSALYLVRPDLRPATAFVSDEPGIQNDCRFGDRIVSQLEQAPKPLITFLAVTQQHREPNRTQDMVSCGRLESYLSNSQYQYLGQCHAYGKLFEVRVY